MTESQKETWGVGAAYDRYVGRWSRLIAREFLGWLRAAADRTWGDVGCGTGALVEAVLERKEPRSILAIDRSQGFVTAAQEKINDPRVAFKVANATALPWKQDACDLTISGLVLNFVPDPAAMISEMVRVTRPGGWVSVYVWDYSGGMEMMRHFWDAAIAANPQDASFDQAERFPICQPEPLKTLFQNAGLTAPEVRAIAIPTVFRDFDDYWSPFLGKQGAAPTYLASLNNQMREQIRASLKSRLTPATDGSIPLTARAWAVRGIVGP